MEGKLPPVEKILPDENINILVIGGHPADVFDTSGGTMARHAARGDKVTALVLTHGGRVHDVMLEELRVSDKRVSQEEFDRLLQERIRVKHQEVQEACDILGVKGIRYLNCEDVVLTLREELMFAIAKVIREVRPHILITHFPFDYGGVADHHAITGQLVLNALSPAASIQPGDPNPPWSVPEVYFFGTPTSLFRHSVIAAEPRCYPDVYVDVSDLVDKKIQAMLKLQSQEYDEDLVRKRLDANEGLYGMLIRVPYAEAFIRNQPHIYDYLPLSHNSYRRAGEKARVMLDRMLGRSQGT